MTVIWIKFLRGKDPEEKYTFIFIATTRADRSRGTSTNSLPICCYNKFCEISTNFFIAHLVLRHILWNPTYLLTGQVLWNTTYLLLWHVLWNFTDFSIFKPILPLNKYYKQFTTAMMWFLSFLMFICLKTANSRSVPTDGNPNCLHGGCPRYTVVEKFGDDLELRCFMSSVWVSISGRGKYVFLIYYWYFHHGSKGAVESIRRLFREKWSWNETTYFRYQNMKNQITNERRHESNHYLITHDYG